MRYYFDEKFSYCLILCSLTQYVVYFLPAHLSHVKYILLRERMTKEGMVTSGSGAPGAGVGSAQI